MNILVIFAALVVSLAIVVLLVAIVICQNETHSERKCKSNYQRRKRVRCKSGLYTVEHLSRK